MKRVYYFFRFGRKKPLLTYFSLAAFFCMSSGVMMLDVDFGISKPKLMTALAIAGKFAMGGLFSVIFLYTAELFPTIIRYVLLY